MSVCRRWLSLPWTDEEELAFDRHLDNGRKSRIQKVFSKQQRRYFVTSSLNRYIDEARLNISHEISHLTLLTDSSSPLKSAKQFLTFSGESKEPLLINKNPTHCDEQSSFLRYRFWRENSKTKNSEVFLVCKMSHFVGKIRYLSMGSEEWNVCLVRFRA